MACGDALDEGRQIAPQVAAGAQEQRQDVDARTAVGRHRIGCARQVRRHQLEERKPHIDLRRTRSRRGRNSLERLGPACVARAVGEQHETVLHRYRTSHVNAAIDNSRYNSPGAAAATQGVQSRSTPRCPATLFSSTKLMPSMMPPKTLKL